ncbi:FMN-binding negative transcriptional regulator [Massilia sp. ST3]|uniref:FMN-binding negative transcriptional regulator n=1 Tax=Massilia sp. ST3 TaxID=2824903 RepID=UPI001B83832A|nr:FMN-binding negative transcriptional regulator [Massilia sp. ST3]MBQ5949143.1 FMN-binding negative transcriptional regulator [Massilia sp. ST3]
MYIAARHRQDRIEPMRDLMATHALGMLVTLNEGLPDADHLPFEFVEDGEHGVQGVLRAHVARANPVWRRAGQQVLVAFRGPAGYVTPDRIEKVEQQGRVVPTWDYHVVHVHGRLRAIEDPAWLLTQVRRQTDRQEAARTQPWSVDDAPRDYIAGMLKAIVGIEIAIERIEGKWKGSAPGAR